MPGDLDGHRGCDEVVEQAERVPDPGEPGGGPTRSQTVQYGEPSEDDRGRGQRDGMEQAVAHRRAEQTQAGRDHPGAEEDGLDVDDDAPWHPQATPQAR